ncbi:hypothetical protein [Magnetospira sp. QH-2]|uniref:hypothetical protein n=1 Tax=Magnetospira sp. (strain QH-2) TaxID=1288970 RepID=UPI0003E81629|nr:hypothetical protein [Magnetospira sp. QH-2]CCQ75282.1 conserved exported protein of unknown function [Magnetospira sp. QH-2]
MNRSPKSLLAALMLGTALTLTAAPVLANPSWHPQSSERLIKLPPSYLQKSLDNDFARSALGQALTTTEQDLSLKTGTLGDLQRAIDTAEGEVRLDLRHQFLAEKREYLNLISERNEMRRKHLKVKRKLFDRMMDKLAEEADDPSGTRQQLIAQQQAARKRFQTSMDVVDQRIFETSMATESKYASQYSQNMQAMEKLLARIKHHDMNQMAEDDDGQPLTRKEHLRRMASDIQTELAMLDQEETMIGYMAKLVALDAMALTEDGLDAELADSDVATVASPVTNLNFFLDN